MDPLKKTQELSAKTGFCFKKKNTFAVAGKSLAVLRRNAHSQCASVADAGIIGSEVGPDKRNITASRCIQDVGFDVYTSTGSSLHAMSEKSAEYLTMLMQIRVTHLKIIQRLLQNTSDIALASIGTTSA